QRDVEWVGACGGRRRDLAVEVARRHREDAAGQVAEVVGEVGVVAIDHALFGEVAVEAVGELTQYKKSEDVGTDVLLVCDGVLLAARALRHLRAAEIQKSVHVEM